MSLYSGCSQQITLAGREHSIGDLYVYMYYKVPWNGKTHYKALYIFFNYKRNF